MAAPDLRMGCATGLTPIRAIGDVRGGQVRAWASGPIRSPARTGLLVLILVPIVLGLEGPELLRKLADLGLQCCDAALPAATLGSGGRFRLVPSAAGLGPSS